MFIGKQYILSLILAITGVSISTASDYDISLRPIEMSAFLVPVGPVQSATTPLFTAYYDDKGIMIYSPTDLKARVMITDTMNGDKYFDNEVENLSPSYRYDFPSLRERLTLHIYVDSIEYTGVFELI